MNKILITILLFVSFVSTAHAVNLLNGSILGNTGPTLVAWWTMDGDDVSNGILSDKSGSGHSLNFGSIASSTFYTTGRIGQAGAFDGVDDFASSTDTTALRPASLTLSAWYNCKSYAAGNTIISKARTAAPWSSPFASWLVRLNSATAIEFGLSNSGYSGTSATVATMQADRWYHIAMTYDGTTRTGYLNGASVLSNSFTAPIGYAAQPVLVGANFGAAPTFQNANCKIDDVRIYSQALTATEITQLYNNSTWNIRGSSSKNYINTSQDDFMDSGLVAYITFDGNDSGWTSCCLGQVNDLSGAGNNGSFSQLQATGTPVAGMLGQAFYMKGDNKAISITDNGTVDLNDFTIATWIKKTGNGTVGGFGGCATNGVEFISAKGLGGGDGTGVDSAWALGVVQSTGKLIGCFEGTTGIDYISPQGSTTISNNIWYHVAFTHTVSNTIIYVNAVPDAYSGTTANPANNNVNVGVGMGIEGATHTPDGSFNGALDDFRIYNRALSADEVLRLYKATYH